MQIPLKLAAMGGRRLLVAQKYSPQILFIAGIAGVTSSTILACRATLKVESILDEHEKYQTDIETMVHDDYSENDRKKDLVLLKVKTAVSLVKLYGPAVTVGTIAVTCLAGSHHILTTRNAGLMAAYATLERGFDEYRARVMKDVGEEKELEYRYGVETITTKDDEGKKVKTKIRKTGLSPYARCFEKGASPEWSPTPEYNQLFLKCQQNWANDMLQARGHVFLNEVYDHLNLSRTSEGAVVGWVLDNGDNYVDFGLFNSDNPGSIDFVNGQEASIWLDFNVDGVIYDKI